ncbi:ligase-associated DNA damage response endonuclease PdeM [Novosphingobium mangrovi (ex Huang et al. 2023)]|uniref:Ligase-associated DNA damage response endonuclease PdeM n=1 Tax=Novosphingobium mangrovi (ex Huang et al. 2023) TaxID=2976432 RepID=A0ABT2HZM3_9SPHN|nr:ligase-associated DNA damage response endonuclease PdeM [Novosphingobium mangrovi (ex Huang et al. 2023)]MCT2398001.1 ligase-associated DNA damage response endonuclease PdeM [Novosphingobium mangrovi (ex Huang et al. 2023)]
MVPFSFRTHEMHLVSGEPGRACALFWPREQALLVADLHLEKGSHFARGGQMLPPYDSRETLNRLAEAVRRTGARRVFALGDNFHDSLGPERLEPHAAGMLAALTRALDWVWITGNHDPELGTSAGGTCLEELEIGGLMLRHMARPGTSKPELSGHFHPRLVVAARGRRIARPCVVRSENRLVLPAFGALTGGMNAADPIILSALQPADAIDALLPAQEKLVHYPLWRKAA